MIGCWVGSFICQNNPGTDEIKFKLHDAATEGKTISRPLLILHSSFHHSLSFVLPSPTPSHSPSLLKWIAFLGYLLNACNTSSISFPATTKAINDPYTHSSVQTNTLPSSHCRTCTLTLSSTPLTKEPTLVELASSHRL